MTRNGRDEGDGRAKLTLGLDRPTLAGARLLTLHDGILRNRDDHFHGQPETVKRFWPFAYRARFCFHSSLVSYSLWRLFWMIEVVDRYVWKLSSQLLQRAITYVADKALDFEGLLIGHNRLFDPMFRLLRENVNTMRP